MAALDSVPQAGSSTPTAVPQDDVEQWSRQYDAAQSAKAAQSTFGGSPDGQPAQQSFLQKWTAPVGHVTTQLLDSAVSAADLIYDTPGMRKARDLASGAITGAANIADSVTKGANKAAELVQPMAEAQRDLGMGAAPQQAIPEPIWDHAKQHIMDFRDAVQVQDPGMSDSLTQGVAQLAIPFAGFSRALSGLHWVSQAVTAGALTDATALGPHDARMADLLSMARHTEGKFGEALRTLAPDGSALNAYINYLSDRTNETEAAGRFKNVLDGFGVNLIATPLLHGVGVVLKQGYRGLRYAIDNGVGSSGGLVPPKMQKGSIGVDPADEIATEQARADMAKAAANPGGKRPPLNQSGVDPAQSIIDEQARRDMAANPPPATLYHGSPQKGITALEPGEKLAARGHGIYLSDDPAVAGAYTPSAGGGLYKVEVPGEHVAGMLHWDKPLSQQPIAEHAFEQLGIDSKGMSAGEAYRALSEKLSPPTGEPGSNTKFNKEGDKAASKALAQAGVPGIRYSSSGKYSQRGATGNNIVVFDPKHANVISESVPRNAAEREGATARRVASDSNVTGISTARDAKESREDAALSEALDKHALNNALKDAGVANEKYKTLDTSKIYAGDKLKVEEYLSEVRSAKSTDDKTVAIMNLTSFLNHLHLLQHPTEK